MRKKKDLPFLTRLRDVSVYRLFLNYMFLTFTKKKFHFYTIRHGQREKVFLLYFRKKKNKIK